MKRFLSLYLFLLFSVFALFSQDSLNMSLVYHWEDTTIVKAPVVRNVYNDIWGYHDPVTGKEYAMIGSTEGIHFFDVTDPQNVGELGMVAGTDDNMIHRDIKTKGHYLFAVSDEFFGGLQIIDLSKLPRLVVVYDSDEFFQWCHNVWVDGDRLYACIPRRAWRPLVNTLAVYDISDPEIPTLIANYPDSVVQWGNVHDMYSKDQIAFLNCESRGLYVVDFTDALNPVILAQMPTYPYQGYNHSGWVSEDGSTYVMADETHGLPMKLLDVSDLSNITQLSYLFPEMTFPIQDTNAIAHNPIIHHHYVFASYYYDGIYIFDVSDRENPTIAGFYDTYPGENDGNFKGAWGVYPFLPSGLVLASDMNTGLYVFDFALTTASIDDTRETQLNVFPNPTTNHLVLEAQSIWENPVISLYDMSGRKVEKKAFSGVYKRLEWEWEKRLSPGVYWVQLATDAGTIGKKILVE